MIKMISIHTRFVKCQRAGNGFALLFLLILLFIPSHNCYAKSENTDGWNDASAFCWESQEVVDYYQFKSDKRSEKHKVFTNVYADPFMWSIWKNCWEKISNDFQQVSITPGEDESRMNFAWYSQSEETPKVRIMDENEKVIASYSGKQKTAKSEKFRIKGKKIVLYPCKVTVEKLESNKSYYYSCYIDGSWTKQYSLKTQDSDDFSVMLLGDAQIGSSKGGNLSTYYEEDPDAIVNSYPAKEIYYAMNDSYNWMYTLSKGIEKNPDLSFIISTGDQVNRQDVNTDMKKYVQQVEYAGFLFPAYLRHYPMATIVGNHDYKSANYKNHFFNPNSKTAASKKTNKNGGSDYYFRYGDVLFLCLNAKIKEGDLHEDVIREAVDKNKDAKWRIVIMHNDIYGSGYRHALASGMVLRTQLTPIFDEYDIDLVFTGHDHTYSRSYPIRAKGKKTAYKHEKETKKYLKDNASCYSLDKKEGNELINPNGTIYYVLNSSTGSKYNPLLYDRPDYIASQSQSWRPTYSMLSVNKDTLKIETYDAASGKLLIDDKGKEATLSISKTK